MLELFFIIYNFGVTYSAVIFQQGQYNLSFFVYTQTLMQNQQTESDVISLLDRSRRAWSNIYVFGINLQLRQTRVSSRFESP